jgi:hypothetical protein
MINASEKYIIGVDITETDIPVLTIARENGKNLQYIQSITGNDAQALYETISKGAIKKRVVMKDHGKAHCPRCINDVHGLGRLQFCPNCGQGLIWPSDGGAVYIKPYNEDERIRVKNELNSKFGINNVSEIIKEAEACVINDLVDRVDANILNYLEGGNKND